MAHSGLQAASLWGAAAHKVDEGEAYEGADSQYCCPPQLRAEDELPVDVPEAPLQISMVAVLCELLYHLADPANESAPRVSAPSEDYSTWADESTGRCWPAEIHVVAGALGFWFKQ